MFKKILAMLAIAFLMPVNTFASGHDRGTITINVYDEQFEEIRGQWFLHRGPNDDGLLMRNGTGSETFQIEDGIYYLKVLRIFNDNFEVDHPFYLINSENSQFLEVNETIRFDVQYFKTEEAMLLASGETLPITAASPVETDNTEIIFDEFGCNRPIGQAWCERSQKCISPWVIACKVDKETTETTEDTEPAPAPVVNSSPQTAPTVVINPAPIQPAPAQSATTTDQSFELAATGPSAILLSLLSLSLAGLIKPKRKK